jgi:hypothetical protein
MLLKKVISVGAFLKKGEDIKDGDILTIANEGKKLSGEFGEQIVILVKKDDKEGNVGLNTTSVNNLIDAYGEDTVNWVGKEVKVMAIRQNVQGKIMPVYYYLHPETIIDEDTGLFVLNATKNDTTK